MDEYDLNEFEDIKRIFFDEFQINEIYVVAIPYFHQRIKEQYSHTGRYLSFKGNLLQGKIHKAKLGDVCLIDLPRSLYDKLHYCANRNSKKIRTYETVRLKFIKYGQKKWEVISLEVE